MRIVGDGIDLFDLLLTHPGRDFADVVNGRIIERQRIRPKHLILGHRRRGFRLAIHGGLARGR